MSDIRKITPEDTVNRVVTAVNETIDAVNEIQGPFVVDLTQSVIGQAQEVIDGGVSEIEMIKNQTEIFKDEAEAARDAAFDSVQYQYIVNTSSELSSVTPPPTEGNNALARDTEHVWRYNGSAWVDLGLGPSAGKADQSEIPPLSRVTTQVDRSFDVKYETVVERAQTSSFAPGEGHYMWCPGMQVGVDIEAGAVISTASAKLRLTASVANVRLRIYKRPTDASTANTGPGAGASDVLFVDMSATPVELGVPTTGALVEARFVFSGFVAEAGYTYLFRYNYTDGAGANASGGFGRRAGATGWTNERRGFFDNNQTMPSADFAMPITLGVTFYQLSSVTDLQNTVGLEISKLSRSFNSEIASVASRVANGAMWPSTDGHYAWSFGVHCAVGADIEPGTYTEAISIPMQLSASLATIRCRMWERPTAGVAVTTSPGASVLDVLVHEQIATLAELGLLAQAGNAQDVQFDLPTFAAMDGKTYLFEYWGFDALGNNSGLGLVRNTSGASLDQTQRGWFRGISALPSPAACSWSLGASVYVSAADNDVGIGLDTRDRVLDCTATATGFAVAVTGSILRNPNTSVEFSGTVTLSTPTTGSVLAESRTLTSRQGTLPPMNYYNPLGGLAHSNVSNVVVKNSAGTITLVPGTDYALEPVNGYVALQTAGASVAVLVDYDWSQCRYDLICVNAETKAIVVVQGTERRRDAGEFLPRVNASTLIPLFYARVASGFAVELIPVWYLDGNLHRDYIEQARNDYENQRRALAPIVDMARRGETIRIAVMGDSIGAQSGGGTPPNDSPNGQYRDRTNYFNMNIGSDVVSAIALYDNGDGAGQVHTRTTHLWDIVRAFEELGGTVEYYNFCIGGKNSGPGTGNGGDPILRAAVWSVEPHLLVTHYGMNETGSANTETWLTDLFAEAMENGVQCVLGLGMPRPGSIKGVSMASVRYTNRQIRRASQFYVVAGERRGAYFSTERLMDDAVMGAMGLSPKEYGGADKFHHPGLHEYRVYGAEIKAMIKGY